MTPQQLDSLEINALALRKIADTVLEQVRDAKKSLAPARRRIPAKIDRVADLKVRILSGKLKKVK